MSRNEITTDMVSAHRARIELRKALLGRIEEKRAELGLTRKGLADRVRMPKDTYYRIVEGQGRAATIDSLILYLHRLGIEVEISIKGAE